MASKNDFPPRERPKMFASVFNDKTLFTSGHPKNSRELRFLRKEGFGVVISLLNDQATNRIRRFAPSGVAIVRSEEFSRGKSDEYLPAFFDLVAKNEVAGKKVLVMCDDGFFTSRILYATPYALAKGLEWDLTNPDVEKWRRMYDRSLAKAKIKRQFPNYSQKAAERRKVLFYEKIRRGKRLIVARPKKRV